jgi:hypothetical protein
MFGGGMTLTSISNVTFTTATLGATCTPITGIYNPIGSGKNCVILQMQLFDEGVEQLVRDEARRLEGARAVHRGQHFLFFLAYVHVLLQILNLVEGTGPSWMRPMLC